MKKSMFTTMPEWVSRKVELPVANVEPAVLQTKNLFSISSIREQ